MIFIIINPDNYDFSHQPIISLGQVDGKSLFFHDRVNLLLVEESW